MNRFPLQIVTPDGLIYEGEAERLCCRTIEGDVAILANQKALDDRELELAQARLKRALVRTSVAHR